MYVAATPEERVRQRLLVLMTRQLGYPKELLSVEKKLSELPHLNGLSGLPNRRADVLCFAKGVHEDYPLFPLLLIECKEGEIGEEAACQALGYNHYVQAPFVALAGENEIKMIYPIGLPFLPSFSNLLEKVCL